jgi:hypothetical protein
MLLCVNTHQASSIPWFGFAFQAFKDISDSQMQISKSALASICAAFKELLYDPMPVDPIASFLGAF